MDVFVYGSLKKTYWNHDLMGDSEFLGEGTTNETFFMYDVGFPYVFEDGEHSVNKLPVRGEVYSVSSDVLRSLDWLEGVPHHYQRRIVQVDVGGEKLSAYMYITNPDHMHDDIESGRCKEENGVWVWS